MATGRRPTTIMIAKTTMTTDCRSAWRGRVSLSAQALAGHADPKMTAHYTKAREVIEVEPVALMR